MIVCTILLDKRNVVINLFLCSLNYCCWESFLILNVLIVLCVGLYIHV